MKKLVIFAFFIFASMVFLGCETTNTTQVITTATTEATTETTTTEAVTTETSVMSTTEATTTALPTTIVTYTGIEITGQSTKFFSIGDLFDKDTIELTAYKSDGSSEIVSSDDFSVRGFSSSTAGTKNLYIIFDDFLAETSVVILEDYAFAINMEYYAAAINLKGNVLKVTLNSIINNDFIGKLYGDARDILQESDVDPNNSSNLIQVYTGNSVDATWDGGYTWNREHVWPQSRLGETVSYTDDTPSRATDLHNLKPADPDENAVRSNHYFGTIVSSYIYEPRDEVKGDIARILFYMSTMYFDLTLNDDETTGSDWLTMGVLSTLLIWNEQDPVDDFEMHRNDVIYSYQNNRNPFIDYPEFANLIWGDLA